MRLTKRNKGNRGLEAIKHRMWMLGARVKYSNVLKAIHSDASFHERYDAFRKLLELVDHKQTNKQPYEQEKEIPSAD